jgi:hypothetical protein
MTVEAKQHPGDLGGDDHGAAPALEVIRILAEDIGPRRPCSEAEARAAHALAGWLHERGVAAELERFEGYASFAAPYGAMLGTAFVGGALQGRHPRLGGLVSAAALAALGLESDLRFTPVSDLLSRRPSANVVATVPARGKQRRRVCLGAHIDSSRSGLIFHPALIPRLALLLRVPGLSAGLLAVAPVARRLPGAGALRRSALAGLALSLALLAERELRGEDVAGASDNASGCGVAAQLIVELAAEPLENTTVDLVVSGCEEAGVLGAQAYLRSHSERARQTIFVNFDTVGGDVPLTYVLREGTSGGVTRPAGTRLVSALERIARRRPELGLRPARSTVGLPTDVTPALARGPEGITLLAQGKTIPHYHWPTDTAANVEPRTVGRAIEVGRELLAEIDRW